MHVAQTERGLSSSPFLLLPAFSLLFQIANFDTNGFENALSGSAPGAISHLTAPDIIGRWDSSPGHREVMQNAGVWGRYQWRSVAIAANDQFAVAWFAPDEDPSAN